MKPADSTGDASVCCTIFSATRPTAPTVPTLLAIAFSVAVDRFAISAMIPMIRSSG